MLPQGFVYLNDPRIILQISYATPDNFMGRIIQDYFSPRCILTEKAATALVQVQNALEKLNTQYRLKIFDAYRPTTAVADFKHWAQDLNDQKMKAHYYPDLSKAELFELGYIAEQSSHSRGSTVDLTITMLNASGGELELDMGTPFDFFGELSHTANDQIASKSKQNRALLVDLMESQGFENYPLEWWHYTLKSEPFPDTYFSFPVR